MEQITADEIAEEALAALSDRGFVGTPGCCEMFVRQVIQAVAGDRFDAYWRGTAFETMRAFQPTPYCVYGEDGEIIQPDSCTTGLYELQAGDLLYKGVQTSGAAGHVGILLAGATLRVAENSSYHINPNNMGDVQGAKGWRTLQAFGPFEAVVRLV